MIGLLVLIFIIIPILIGTCQGLADMFGGGTKSEPWGCEFCRAPKDGFTVGVTDKTRYYHYGFCPHADDLPENVVPLRHSSSR